MNISRNKLGDLGLERISKAFGSKQEKMVFEYVGRKSLLGSNLENLDQSELKE